MGFYMHTTSTVIDLSLHARRHARKLIGHLLDPRQELDHRKRESKALLEMDRWRAECKAEEKELLRYQHALMHFAELPHPNEGHYLTGPGAIEMVGLVVKISRGVFNGGTPPEPHTPIAS